MTTATQRTALATASAAPQADTPEEELEQRAKRLSAQLGGADAKEILTEAVTRLFPGKIALVSSFGAESASLLHLVAEVDPSTPVIFVDTGKHFAQTISYRKKLAKRLGLTDVRDVRPDEAKLSANDPHGDLWNKDADACCTMRKVEPLTDVLDGFDAWITGRKQFQGGGRSRLPVFEASAPHIKVNPLVRWTKEDLDAYAEAQELPAHPLVAQGYPSIGCWPCTHPAAAEEDPRAGRWRGAAKTECGIHAMGRV